MGKFILRNVTYYTIAMYSNSFKIIISMSLGGGIDQALLDALEAAYKDVRVLYVMFVSKTWPADNGLM